MPCYTDPPTHREKQERLLNDFLDEIGEETPCTEHLFVGGKGRKMSIEKMSQILCSYLKDVPATSFSLELQIWWRDHQRDDARHEAERRETEKRKKLIKQALAKLTPEEKAAITGK